MRMGLLCCGLVLVGCGQADNAISLRTTPPAESAAAIMQVVDADHDGKISADELAAAPGLAAGAERIDEDKDKTVTNKELVKRLATYANGPGAISVAIHVSAKDQPLAAASVTLTPEPFMGEGAPTFKGVTDQAGSCELAGADGTPSSIPVGYYRVQITHQATGADKSLGCEIAGDASGNRLAFRL
jgi:hypothetical protein